MESPSGASVERVLPARPLPPYSYVTGLYPHPKRDAAGHWFGQESEPLDDFAPQNWRDCESYLFGIDLFNLGYYWEAHEQWEAVWVAARRRGERDVALFLNGLIKLAAAGVKAREGRVNGVRRHARRAAQRLEESATQQKILGLDVARLIEFARWLERHAEATIHTQRVEVVRVWEFSLRLS